MADKTATLDAVLKEAVDLVIRSGVLWMSFGEDDVLMIESHGMALCRRIYKIEEVFENLRCSKEGLTTEAVEERLEFFFFFFINVDKPQAWNLRA
ncbi:Proton-exporting ATPase protein [Dioscorea alata]|uniref:Proton-exporting ATPase protein n=1 Tax=Dioscorea alata TaxID=55571 RepID=A0ACB7U681_DIOAL|nr:Proton-exporting ATPase protein [Dioscorea alata]